MIDRPASSNGKRGNVAALAAIAVFLLAVGRFGTPELKWADETLQLTLSAAAAVSCWGAARRAAGLARAFWLLLGTGMLLWSGGQSLWMLGGSEPTPGPLLMVMDLAFLAYPVPIIAAFVVRPDRQRSGGLGLAFDVTLACILTLHLYLYFAPGYTWEGGLAEYRSWYNHLRSIRDVTVLAMALWLLRSARGHWKRVYEEVAGAILVLQGLAPVTEQALLQNRYSQGLLDLPWTLPFALVALAAARWIPAEEPALPLASLAHDWAGTRRGTVLAVVALVLAPVLYFSTAVSSVSGPAAARGRITFVTTLLAGALFALRQIDVLRRAEEAFRLELETRARLMHAERMSAAGMLVASVAHEINNPLSVVLGQAELLARRADEASRARLASIREGAERCARIVRNLLLFARGSRGERGPVYLTPLVEQVLELEAHDLRVRGIEVLTDLDRTARIHGDAGQLQQVLVNLISNSVHAMSRAHGRGTLWILLRVLDDRLVRIEIADDGPGIPAHSRDQALKPLFTTKPPGEGTGLGLPICQDIVRTHGGGLALLDAPGGGLLVRIDMPVGEPEAVREELDSGGAPQELSGRRVLVVDDEPLVRDLLAELLSDAGCRVTAADSGEAALAVLRSTEPDLVVSDVRMPGLGGAELYRLANEIRPQLRHRFLFVSGDTADPDTWSFLAGSGCESVQKPFQSDAVLAAVTRTLAL